MPRFHPPLMNKFWSSGPSIVYQISLSSHFLTLLRPVWSHLSTGRSPVFSLWIAFANHFKSNKKASNFFLLNKLSLFLVVGPEKKENRTYFQKKMGGESSKQVDYM